MRHQRSAYAKARRYERGTMNKTEAAYARVLEARQKAGHVAAWHYEALTLRLGPDCRWTPDFLVELPDGELQLHEVKANRQGKWHAEDDAKVKIKVASELYPFRVFVCFPRDTLKLHFEQQEIAA